MNVPFYPILVAQRRFPELTAERLAEYSGDVTLTSRTVRNVVTGATVARDGTDGGFFNMLTVLVKERKVPPFDRDIAEVEHYQRKRFETLSNDITAKKCNFEKLRDFLFFTGCPTLRPVRQTSWDLMVCASYARYYNADLRYDAVKAYPNQLGDNRIWLGSDQTCLRRSAGLYRESFAGFKRAKELIQSAPDFDDHRPHFDFARNLLESMMVVSSVNLVAYAIEAEDEGWDMGTVEGEASFPQMDEAAEKIRSAVPSRSACVILANKLTQFLDSDEWKSRVSFNAASALLAMVCLPGENVEARTNIITELCNVFRKLTPAQIVMLSKLPTTRRAMQLGLLPPQLLQH